MFASQYRNMGIADRKAKEKEDLKALILKGAKNLFVEKGVDHTTIRSIANNINYSVGTVYVYFKDKNSILHALHTQVLRNWIAILGYYIM